VPAARLLGLKLADPAPELSVPEVAVPTTVAPEFLMVKTTVPSLTAAVVEVLETVALRATEVEPYVAEAEAADVDVLARMMNSAAGVPLASWLVLSLAVKLVVWAKLA
jgi:hypothetical protein